MGLLEDNTHSFVVKICVVEKPEDEEEQQWQGEITHVATGARFLFTHWEKMERFLKTHLQETKTLPKSKLTWNRWRPGSQASPPDDYEGQS